MHWMVRWAGGFPLFVAAGEGAYLTDVDGHRYLDLCLGDTGAMTGHAPAATVEAVRAQAARGFTFMLPTEDAVWVGEELARRFGLPYWQFAVTATDANRFAIRLARAHHRAPEDPGVQLVLSRHGGRDLRHAAGRPRRGARRQRRARRWIPPLTTRVVEFNDLPALEAAPGAMGTWHACSPSRRSPTSASCIPSRASTRRSASSPAGPARCSSSTRRTRSAPGPAGTPARTGSSPTC